MKLAFGKREFVSIAIFLVALVPRLIQPNRINVIPDQWRDYGEALAMLSGKYIPLLGIPSSVPRFSQGPLNVWFAALAFAIGGVNPLAPVVMAALMTSLGVVLSYWLMRRYVGEGVAFLTALIWALSPAAITQSRVPFYLFAIPVFLVIYLEALLKLRQGTRLVVFWAALSFFLLFQWELATIPLIVLLPIALYRHKLVQVKYLPSVLVGMGFGLLPQILFDLGHRCQQLCAFVVWMGYRTAATTGFDGRHSLTALHSEFWGQVGRQLQRLVGFNSPFGLVAVLILSAVGVFSLRKRSSELGMYAALGTILLTIGLVIHGDPSEAYFPPFLVLISLLAALGFSILVSKSFFLNVIGCIKRLKHEIAIVDRYLKRWRLEIRGKTIIHVFGDSHVLFMQDPHLVLHHLGPATAHNLINPNSSTQGGKQILRFLSGASGRRTKVMFVFGEIDCRIHLNQISKSKDISLNRAIQNTVLHYGQFLTQVKRDFPKIQILVLNVLPPGDQGNRYNVSHYPSRALRLKITRQFNRDLSRFCVSEGLIFVELFGPLIDDQGRRKSEYVFEDAHYNKKACRLVLEAIKNYL